MSSWDAPTGQIPRPAPVLLASVTPSPTDEEVVAIVAAMEGLWPQPMGTPWNGTLHDESSAWRFSGRWWARPLPARRARPWR